MLLPGIQSFESVQKQTNQFLFTFKVEEKGKDIKKTVFLLSVEEVLRLFVYVNSVLTTNIFWARIADLVYIGVKYLDFHFEQLRRESCNQKKVFATISYRRNINIVYLITAINYSQQDLL
jgi:hypothetical protein